MLGDRPVSVSREISKLHEETLRGSAETIAATLAAKPAIKGEFVIVIGAQEKAPEQLTEADITKEIEQALLDHPFGQGGVALLVEKTWVCRVMIFTRVFSHSRAKREAITATGARSRSQGRDHCAVVFAPAKATGCWRSDTNRLWVKLT